MKNKRNYEIPELVEVKLDNEISLKLATPPIEPLRPYYEFNEEENYDKSPFE